MSGPRKIIATTANAGRIDAVLHHDGGMSWSSARRWIETGKVSVQGEVVTSPATVVPPGGELEVHENAPRRMVDTVKLGGDVVVFCDPYIVVARKPPGMSTVPFEEGERDTFDQLLSRVIHRGKGPAPSLGVVQRLDKDTSGLLVFARTFAAKKGLAGQLRAHSMHRRYLALVNGLMFGAKTFRSRITANRGDGLRGSTRLATIGQLAVTHVTVLETFAEATLVHAQLETGRTHQIRIHLSEDGHPIVGERVYNRHFAGTQLAAKRPLLHAAELGFIHPITQREHRFEELPPADFSEALEALRRSSATARNAGATSSPRPAPRSR